MNTSRQPEFTAQHVGLATPANSSAKLIEFLESKRAHGIDLDTGRMKTSAATPFSLAYDAALETAIIGIRAGKSIAEVIHAAIQTLRENFPDVDQEDVNSLARDIRDAHEKAKAKEPPLLSAATKKGADSKVRAILPGFVKRMKGNVASALVIAYALFVVGSLFCAPWALTYSSPASLKIYWAPIFYPPTTYGRVPRLMFEEILLVWGALGILTAAVVWVLSKHKIQGKTP